MHKSHVTYEFFREYFLDRPGALVEIELGAAELQAPDDEALDLRHHDALTTPRARHGWARNTSRTPRARRPPNASIENLLLPWAAVRWAVGLQILAVAEVKVADILDGKDLVW